ncbi:MAG TPA: recombination mediator RecR [Gammaproteobacteria bacterium]|nr:recombination mediator RecR [Gammaproteobacteria bacterium]
MSFSPLINQLIVALRCLPGVGAKSAQRMAFHILQRNKDGGQQLAQTLLSAIAEVGNCQQCRTLSELQICTLCQNLAREAHMLCIVETPADIIAIEQTGAFRGLYFVLMGHLSPIDGIGPEQLGIDHLRQRLQTGVITEIIMATSTTVEGETTAYYIAEMAKVFPTIKTTRLALGMPLGGELEHLDGSTLARALSQRSRILEGV